MVRKLVLIVIIEDPICTQMRKVKRWEIIYVKGYFLLNEDAVSNEGSIVFLSKLEGHRIS